MFNVNIPCNKNDIITDGNRHYKVVGFSVHLKEIRGRETIDNPSYTIPPEHLDQYEILNEQQVQSAIQVIEIE
jgi:hypothetical protein